MTGREHAKITDKIADAIASIEEAQELLDATDFGGVSGSREAAFIAGCIHVAVGALEDLRAAFYEKAGKRPSHS